MQNKRKRILTMLENGKISMDEALSLLENLDTETDSDSQGNASGNQEWQQKVEDGDQKRKRKTYFNRKDDSSMDEFFDDLRNEFTTVGERFMQIMQTTVQKVKDFDIETPFGQPITFNQTITKPATAIEEILIDIDNGKVTIHSSDEEDVRAEFIVKTHNSESEEEAKTAFNEKILFVTDDHKLRLSSAMKLTNVQVDLHVPKKVYAKLSARLINGSFTMTHMEIKEIRVKTANGKIDVSELAFKEAEFETANGPIELREIKGEELEAETLNGRIYVDGELVDVKAQSLSGNVVITTNDKEAEKVEAKTVSGSVELYIPSDVSISGDISSNMGKLDLQLNDVNRTSEHEQFLQKSIVFSKDVEVDGETEKSRLPLRVVGETKTGSVFVCYNV